MSKARIVPADAIVCERPIPTKIVESGGDCVFPIKDNQRSRECRKMGSRSRFFSLARYDSGVERAPGRIERRVIDVLPAETVAPFSVNMLSTVKVFLIVDDTPSHKANMVKNFVEGNPDAIEAFFLPPYAHELNPDEFACAHVKTRIAKATAKHRK